MSFGLAFLHGIGGSADTWQPQVAHFQGRFEVLAWNAPGHGGTPPLDKVSVANLAGRLAEDIDRAGLEKTVVVGHSFGGMVAQQFVRDYPGKVAGLVLSATSAAFGSPDGDFQKQFVADRTRPLDEGKSMAQMASQVMPKLLGSNAGQAAIDIARNAMSTVPEQTYRATVALLTTFDLRADLANIAVPVLVIAGEQDRMTPPQMMERMALRIPGARFELMKDTGHLAPMEKPIEFNSLVESFVGEIHE
ncbi:MAG: alpha/beta fold hydrolase [Aestuariivirgaceae bacterium]